MARIYAGILGLLAFLTSLAHGLLHDGDSGTIVWNAWCSLWVFAAVGYVLGSIAARTVDDSVEARITAELAAEEAQQKAPKSPSAS